MTTHLDHISNTHITSGLIATIGSFDGVHAGHRTILRRMIDVARSQNMESAVITFDPHPRMVIEGVDSNIKLLSSLEEKEYLLSKLGIDHLIVLKFDDSLRSLTAKQFTDQILISKLGIKSLLIGYNNHIGSDKQLSMDFLKKYPSISSIVIPKVDIENEKISSTIIRDEIIRGSLEKAVIHLEHPYIFIAKISQDGTIESDTINKLIPKDGIYQATINSVKTDIQITHSRLKIINLQLFSEIYNSRYLVEFHK